MFIINFCCFHSFNHPAKRFLEVNETHEHIAIHITKSLIQYLDSERCFPRTLTFTGSKLCFSIMGVSFGIYSLMSYFFILEHEFSGLLYDAHYNSWYFLECVWRWITTSQMVWLLYRIFKQHTQLTI